MSDSPSSNTKKYVQVNWDESLKEKSWDEWDLPTDIPDEELIAEREANWLRFYKKYYKNLTAHTFLPAEYIHSGNYPLRQILHLWICSFCNRASKVGTDLHSDCASKNIVTKRSHGSVVLGEQGSPKRTKSSVEVSDTDRTSSSLSSDSPLSKFDPENMFGASSSPFPPKSNTTDGSPDMSSRKRKHSHRHTKSIYEDNVESCDRHHRRYRDDRHHSSSSNSQKSSQRSHKHKSKNSRHRHSSRESSRRHGFDRSERDNRESHRHATPASGDAYRKKRHRDNSGSRDRKRHHHGSNCENRSRGRSRSKYNSSQGTKLYENNQSQRGSTYKTESGNRHSRNYSKDAHRNASQETLRCTNKDNHRTSSVETTRCDSRGSLSGLTGIQSKTPEISPPDSHEGRRTSGPSNEIVCVSVSEQDGSLIRHYDAQEAGITNCMTTPNSAQCTSVPMELIQKDITFKNKEEMSKSEIHDAESETEDKTDDEEEEVTEEPDNTFVLNDNEYRSNSVDSFCPQLFENCLNSPILSKIELPGNLPKVETRISGLKTPGKKEFEIDIITIEDDSNDRNDSSPIPTKTLPIPQKKEIALCRIPHEIENLLLESFSIEKLVNLLQYLVIKPSANKLTQKLGQYPETLFKGINASDKNASYLIRLVRSTFKDFGTTQETTTVSELNDDDVAVPPFDVLNFFNILRSSNYLENTYCQRYERTAEITVNSYLLLEAFEELLSRLIEKMISEECSTPLHSDKRESEFTDVMGQAHSLAMEFQNVLQNNEQCISTNSTATVSYGDNNPFGCESAPDNENPADLLDKYIKKYQQYDLTKPNALDIDTFFTDNLPESPPVSSQSQNEPQSAQVQTFSSYEQNYASNIATPVVRTQANGQNYVASVGHDYTRQSQVDHTYRQNYMANSCNQNNMPISSEQNNMRSHQEPMPVRMRMRMSTTAASNRMEHQTQRNSQRQQPYHVPSPRPKQTNAADLPSQNSNANEFYRILHETPQGHYSTEVPPNHNQMWTPDSRNTMTGSLDLQNPNNSSIHQSQRPALANNVDSWETGHQRFGAYDGAPVAGNSMVPQNSRNMYSTGNPGGLDPGQRAHCVQNGVHNSRIHMPTSHIQRPVDYNYGNNGNGQPNSCAQVAHAHGHWAPQTTGQSQPCTSTRGPTATLHYGSKQHCNQNAITGENPQQKHPIPQQYLYKAGDDTNKQNSGSDEHELSPISVTGWSPEQQQRNFEQQQRLRMNIAGATHQQRQQMLEQAHTMQMQRAHSRIQPQPERWHGETATAGVQQQNIQYQHAQQQQKQQRLYRAQQMTQPQQHVASEQPTSSYCPQRGNPQQQLQHPMQTPHYPNPTGNGGSSQNVINQFNGNLNDGNVQFEQNFPESIPTHVNACNNNERNGPMMKQQQPMMNDTQPNNHQGFTGQNNQANYQNNMMVTQSNGNNLQGAIKPPAESQPAATDADMAFICELLGF